MQVTQIMLEHADTLEEHDSRKAHAMQSVLVQHYMACHELHFPNKKSVNNRQMARTTLEIKAYQGRPTLVRPLPEVSCAC